MEQLDLNSVHQRLLNIATIVDELCEKHGIPLYMISGTMLGAVRHKGFIPWDDDMDFAVPYGRYDDLITILQNELPNNMRCLAFNQSDTYKSPWIKVEDTKTRVIDSCLDLPEERMPGLTIDIFPLVSCNKNESEAIVRKIQDLMKKKRMYSISKSKFKNYLKRIIRFFMSFSTEAINDKIMDLLNKIPDGDYYIIPVDPNYYNKYFPVQWFAPLTKYKFENQEFYGVSNYNNYLTEIYHNYMQLPPEDKRRIHLENVYIIDNK